MLWHRVKFEGSCSQEVSTPSRECSACFKSFQGTWRTFVSMKPSSDCFSPKNLAETVPNLQVKGVQQYYFDH